MQTTLKYFSKNIIINRTNPPLQTLFYLFKYQLSMTMFVAFSLTAAYLLYISRRLLVFARAAKIKTNCNKNITKKFV